MGRIYPEDAHRDDFDQESRGYEDDLYDDGLYEDFYVGLLDHLHADTEPATVDLFGFGFIDCE